MNIHARHFAGTALIFPNVKTEEVEKPVDRKKLRAEFKKAFSELSPQKQYEVEAYLDMLAKESWAEKAVAKGMILDWKEVIKRVERVARELDLPPSEVRNATLYGGRRARPIIDFARRYHQDPNWLLAGDAGGMCRQLAWSKGWRPGWWNSEAETAIGPDADVARLGEEFDRKHAEWRSASTAQDELDRAKPGSKDAEAAYKSQAALMSEVNKLIERLMKAKAQTVEGMRIKVRAYREWFGDGSGLPEDGENLAVSLAADLDAMAARATANA